MAAWEEFQNFAFHCKKTNGRLSTTAKFRISLQNNEWPFGYNCKICISLENNEWPFGYTHYIRFVDYKSRNNIVIKFFAVCTTKWSKKAFTTAQFFIKIEALLLCSRLSFVRVLKWGLTCNFSLLTIVQLHWQVVSDSIIFNLDLLSSFRLVFLFLSFKISASLSSPYN